MRSLCSSDLIGSSNLDRFLFIGNWNLVMMVIGRQRRVGMVLFDVFNVLVGAQGFKDAVVDFAPEDGGVGVVLSCMAPHVFGQAETLAADFALMWFFL